MTIIHSVHGVTERLEECSPEIFVKRSSHRDGQRAQRLETRGNLKEVNRNLHWKGGTKTIYKIPVRKEESSWLWPLSQRKSLNHVARKKQTKTKQKKHECESMFAHKNPSVKQARCSPFQKDPCTLGTSAP